MNLIEVQSHFTKISIARYIINKIQDCALSHLKLKDMGKLRDRMEGQLYFDILKRDVLSEYIFEKILFNKKFDWNKRMLKSYNRKQYLLNEKNIRLIPFEPSGFPQVKVEDLFYYVFVLIKNDSDIYVSGYADGELIRKHGRVVKDGVFEFPKFEVLFPLKDLL